nr:basic proline-rich protein-like [Delphinus delphis]
MRVTARLPETRARGAPPLPSPSPLLVFRTFCLPKPKSLTHPSQLQPLSPLSPSSSLLGAALASGEQLVAHSSPRLGEGGGGLGSALRPEALGAGRGTTATKRARNGSPSSSAAPVSIRAPRLTGSRPHGDLRTGEHSPPSPLIRPRPLAHLAPPLQGLSSAHSAGPPGPYATPPCRSPALSRPLPALPQGSASRGRRAPPPSSPRPRPLCASGRRRLRDGRGRRGPSGSQLPPRLST